MAKNNNNNKYNDSNNRSTEAHHPTFNLNSSSPGTSPKKVIGKIGGIMFLLLILIVMFVAIRGKHNEMMYVALTFTFFVIALFSYGYWSAVNRGDGIWQYIGPNNLQHQQMSNPNYHFDQLSSMNIHHNYKNHPKSKSYLVTPPKMGGVKLEIYTPGDNFEGDPHHHHHHNHHHHHHHRHHHHRHHLHHPHQQKTKSNPDLTQSGNETDQQLSEYEFDSEPVKCQVQLPQISLQNTKHFTEDFTEVFLPDKKSIHLIEK